MINNHYVPQRNAGGSMIRWFLNKSLRFQITFVMILVLSLPTAVAIGNLINPSYFGQTVKTMQSERIKNVLYYLDDNIDKAEIYDLKNNNTRIREVEKKLDTKFEPHSSLTKGIKINIFFNFDSHTYTFGLDKEDKSFSKSGDKRDDMANKNYMEDINSVVDLNKDKIDYITSENKDIIRYFHPITYNNEIIAIVWGESVLPSEISSNKRIFGYIAFFGTVGLGIGLFLMLIILKSLNGNIVKIRSGLEIMSNDLSHRIEDMGGDLGKVVESINAMTEALEKKEQLEERLAMAEKLASLGQMISGVAHEIRNPLGIIRGTVQLMERDYKNVQGLDEYIRIVKEQSDRENRVIQELLDYARPSKQVLMEIDIDTLIHSILSFTSKYIQEKNINLQLQLQENLPKLYLDCDKIKQVFVNVVINACEAMKSKGTLTIKTGKEDKWINIEFEDTGIGMDENEIKKIFNPYYTTKPKGTGIGLSISNGIIQMHGGLIQVKSVKGKGSTFIIKLPFRNG